jgi:hypothetical protein
MLQNPKSINFEQGRKLEMCAGLAGTRGQTVAAAHAASSRQLIPTDF